MVGAFLAVVGAIVAQQPKAPPVDRSGEATFKKILEWAGSLKKTHGVVLRSFKESGKEIFYPDGLMEFWIDNDRFRVTYGDMWGGAATVISDGKKVLDDSASDPIVIRNALKCVPDCSPNLESTGSASSPFLYMLSGPSMLDRFAKDQPIYEGPAKDGDHVLIWESKLFGKTWIYYKQVKTTLEVTAIEYDNVAWQEQMHTTDPEDFDVPDHDNIWRQRLVISDLRRPKKDLFSVKPGRGREVDDTTEKPKKPPEL